MTKTNEAQKDASQKSGLDLLREPFLPNQISKLPKPTKRQTDDVKADFKAGIRCDECGGWHHPKVVHLDYVGHAALTDRLLDCDPEWNWEPVTFDENGNPQTDSIGGMWIRLTVCNVTRLGYGNADGKQGGNAIKEVIGDALRNAAMRFGAALDLWHKGDLHDDGDETPPEPKADPKQTGPSKKEIDLAVGSLMEVESTDELKAVWTNLYINFRPIANHKDVLSAKNKRRAELSAPKDEALSDDEKFLKGE